MTVKDIIKNSSLPNNESELLLAFLLQLRREDILSHPEREMTKKEERTFQLLEQKRLENWSIACLVGKKHFYKLDFIVNKHVLVPRPETELLLEKALEEIQKDDNKKEIIDVGTGSGAIIISLAKELGNKHNYSAIDISKKALRIAKKNIKKHEVNIKTKHSNLLSKIDINELKDKHLVIVANLPYLTTKQIASSSSIQREPNLALDGGIEGLKYYEQLFNQLKEIECGSLACFCEIDPIQENSIKVLIEKEIKEAEIIFHKDIHNNTRLVVIIK